MHHHFYIATAPQALVDVEWNEDAAHCTVTPALPCGDHQEVGTLTPSVAQGLLFPS